MHQQISNTDWCNVSKLCTALNCHFDTRITCITQLSSLLEFYLKDQILIIMVKFAGRIPVRELTKSRNQYFSLSLVIFFAFETINSDKSADNISEYVTVFIIKEQTLNCSYILSTICIWKTLQLTNTHLVYHPCTVLFNIGLIKILLNHMSLHIFWNQSAHTHWGWAAETAPGLPLIIVLAT